jgi:hypothetical protein
VGVGNLFRKFRERRRDRRLARDLELRFRELLDSRVAAAARLVDDLRQP